MGQETRISGIFSCKTTIKVGFGTTKQAALSETYWFVKELETGRMQVQSLDMDFKRQGQPFEISREKLFEDYHLEPDLSYRLLSQPLLVGDHYRATNKPANAEQEYHKIRRIDEDNIRANFGLGLVYLALDKTDKATYIFDRLVRLEEAFEPRHKHLFNEFGISLRKKRLFDEAHKYYSRARELSPDDDHLLLNIARVYFEQNRLPEAEAAAREALALNPDLAEARRLLTRIWDGPRREEPLPDI
ncbi:Tetratricopeptide TPR_2 repeat-containing protein [Solidesulfovibrio carbinoliphilus subsp. oakridgensis]|uniref:Tetratricopeptide TPR_2 repeat-containing protein n=1 Tax=Solidesulfovibrio carbinoliphilus subsp. oakridgensis TaxID=694327 RepID=G7QDH7_9BACT|nr:tetratricopeptide repeat protein [Solidesulfovibrio carbinoliphilus]EHJ46483.1 Tetratricopeptide TPR_2 repeat-containing protein [Solidesulfovibrio carbinoliphilus subsp. oakridgensis]